MTEDERQKFDFFTLQLERLAYASASQQTAPVAKALMPLLANEISAAFPDVKASLSAQRDALLAAQADAASVMKAIGPGLWKILHERAKDTVTDLVAEKQWLQDFAGELTCGNCRQFYTRWLQSNPPDFAHYAQWMVSLHNAVNTKLGKTVMPLEEALARWA